MGRGWVLCGGGGVGLDGGHKGLREGSEGPDPIEGGMGLDGYGGGVVWGSGWGVQHRGELSEGSGGGGSAGADAGGGMGW